MKHNPEFIRLMEQAGVVFMAPGGGAMAMDYLPEGMTHNINLAMDAQPGLVTVSNAGIPSYLSNYLDPNIIKVLLAPMRAAEIIGESQKGDWVTDTATFPVVEMTGEVSSYGDYNNNGSSGANANFNTRQSYHYQTFTEWGEKELARAGLAKLDWASQQNMASVNALNRYQNKTYFFGVANLKLYGLLNDPSLPTALTPTGVWSALAAEVVYDDVRRMFKQGITQLLGVIDNDAKCTLAMSPGKKADLLKTNQFEFDIFKVLKVNFPNMEFKTAPEYSTQAGELVQLIFHDVEGQQTATAGFTEKLRAHPVVVNESSYRQKKSQGTWGTIIFRPICFVQMIGV